MIQVLENANSRGLEPDDYDASRWPTRLAKLRQNPSEQDLVSFDTALTVSAMRYIRAIHVGRVLIVYGTVAVNEENQIRFLTTFTGMTRRSKKLWPPVIHTPGE